MGYRLMTLIVIESETAQVIVGQPVVLQRGNLVLTGGLPMALCHREAVGIGLGADEALEGLGIGVLGDGEGLAGCLDNSLAFVEVGHSQGDIEFGIACTLLFGSLCCLVTCSSCCPMSSPKMTLLKSASHLAVKMMIQVRATKFINGYIANSSYN